MTQSNLSKATALVACFERFIEAKIDVLGIATHRGNTTNYEHERLKDRKAELVAALTEEFEDEVNQND